MDTILRGTIAGFSGSVVFLLLNWIFYVFHALPMTTVHYSAKLLTPPGTPLTALPMAIGLIGFFVGGTAAGLLPAYLLRWTGRDHAWLKGPGVGAVLWPIHVAIIPGLVAPRLFGTLSPTMALATFIFDVIWGGVAVLVLLILPERPLLPGRPAGEA